MNDLVRDELEKMLKQWQAGTPVRTIAIGHRTRSRKNEHGYTVHDPIPFRQSLAFECVFRLIQVGICQMDDFPFPEFQRLAHSIADEHHLSMEEYESAASFAWVVLHRGWARALEGHHERHYITVKRAADA